MKSFRNKNEAEQIITRINSLTPQTERKWGKMNASQMLAHCNLALEMAVGDRQFKYPFMMKLLGRYVIKKTILDKQPYKPGLPTGKDLIIREERNFEKEKERMMTLVKKYISVDDVYLSNRMHPFIGKLKPEEWDWMQYKHLDHHLRQFGV